jgi:predicted MFS family arabinose efflux permease
MAWSYHTKMLGVHTLIFCALGLGLAYALALPVQTALVPMLVQPTDATNAVRMNSVSYNTGRALAPVLSVLVILSLGPDLIFILNAASFIVFAFCLASVLPRPNHTSGQMRVHHDQKESDDPGRAHVTDGFKTALRHRRILLLLAIVAAVTFADDPIFVQSPALAHAKLQISTQWAGYFIAALGWGSVIGSLPLTSKKDNAKRASKRAAIGLVILSVSVLIFTRGFSPLISLLAAFVAGAAGLYTGTAAQTALLRHQKNMAVISVASVAALWAIAWAGTKPFASLLDGVLATHLGLTPSAFFLVFPALTIAFGEMVIPSSWKKGINAWAGRVIAWAGRVISYLRFRLLSPPVQQQPLAHTPPQSPGL